MGYAMPDGDTFHASHKNFTRILEGHTGGDSFLFAKQEFSVPSRVGMGFA